MANNVCINFGRKYACYRKWLSSYINMKVLIIYVKDGGLNRKNVGGFVFGSNTFCDKKKVDTRATRRS